MKKILLSLCFLMFLSRFAQAQIPDGSIAPDFTAKDLTGKEWHLYDLLAAGKTVIIDVSATWCGPCWYYHNTGALENIHENYGPDGSNEIVVLFVEGDPTTNTECLYNTSGCNSSSQGNWVATTDYPIIDDATISSLYDIGYYPTIFAICPNRRVFEIGQVPPTQIVNFHQNCPEAVGANNAGIFRISTGTGSDYFCGTTSIQPSVEFQNLGSENLTSASFSLKIGGNVVQTKNWTGNLATYDLAEFVLDPYLLVNEEFTDIEISIDHVNGKTDENLTDNAQNAILVPTSSVVEETEVKFEMRTDAQGKETYWEFRDGSGQVLYSGGNPNATPGGLHTNLTGGYDPNFTVKQNFFLPGPDCYEFYILDDSGNGLASPAYFKITDKSGSVLIENAPFTKEFSNYFKAENIPVGTNSILENAARLAVSPNPTKNEAKISWQNIGFEPLTLVVSDILGKTVREISVSENQKSANLELANLNSGIYNVQLIGKFGRMQTKLVVE